MSSGKSSGITIWIPVKTPSLNDYIRACRANRYAGGQMKKRVEDEISIYLRPLRRYEEPVTIDFYWIEKTRRRDLDNVAFGKKFVLDALVKAGKLKDDNRRCVTAFSDTFDIGQETGVFITIKEDRHGSKETGREPDADSTGGSP